MRGTVWTGEERQPRRRKERPRIAKVGRGVRRVLMKGGGSDCGGDGDENGDGNDCTAAFVADYVGSCLRR